MREALEVWNEEMFKSLLPRIHQIVQEINVRCCKEYYSKSVDGNTIAQQMKSVNASSIEPDGLQALQNAILTYYDSLGAAGETLLVTNARHVNLLQAAASSLSDALDALQLFDLDCASIDIGKALRHLGAITGDNVDEEVIAAIFSQFCLGK